MRKIYCGTSGSNEVPSTHKLSEVPVSVELLKAVLSFYGSDLQLRPAQDEAVFAHDLLTDDRNAIIATPTNSGKSLLSYLLLLNSAIEGKTFITFFVSTEIISTGLPFFCAILSFLQIGHPLPLVL